MRLEEEDDRFAELKSLAIIDSEWGSEFQEIVELVSQVCHAPIALISLLDRDRQIIKSSVGWNTAEIVNKVSFCHVALHGKELMVVEDALFDDRFSTRPLVVGNATIRFYAGMPIITPDYNVLGTLCVMDHKPRKLTQVQRKAISTLTKQVMLLVMKYNASHLNAPSSIKDKESNFSMSLRDNDINDVEERIRVSLKQISNYLENSLKKSLRETSDYRYALDQSSIIAITDQKGIIKYVNQNFCKISKYSATELIGQDHRIINSGYHTKPFIRDLWMTIAHGKIWKGEIKNKAKDGTFYWVDTTIIPFLNDQDKPYQYVAIRSDITDRKQMEENLRSSLKETSDYKYALDQSSIIAITDQKGVIKYVNENFCKISKYTKDELIGQDHRIINSGYHAKEVIRDLWRTIANGRIWRGELKNKAKDGTFYWVDTTIVPFLDEGSKPFQYLAIRSDITNRKIIEESLTKSLKETSDYKYALDQSSIVAITNQKGIITYVNEYFCKISKYRPDELIGQDHRIINSGHHKKEFFKDLWVTIAHGNIWKGTIKNRAKDGSYYWVDTTIVPFLDESGKPYQYVALRVDVTQKVENQIKLKESKENLEELTQKLLRQNHKLSSFAHILSHNLRSPVSNLSSLLNLYHLLNSPKERKEIFGKFQTVIHHLTNTLNEIIEGLKIQEETQVVTEMLDFQEYLDRVAEILSGQILESGATILANFSKASTICYNKGYLESILLNLLSNAIKYRSPDRNLEIRVETLLIDGSIILNVSDNGLGIDLQRNGSKLFGLHKTFHRHPDAKGVGLFLTKTQIESMNGSITVKSEVNKGSTFTVAFNSQISHE